MNTVTRCALLIVAWPCCFSVTAASDGATQAQLVEAYGKLPLSFEINRGQTDSEVSFLSRGLGYTLFLTSTEAVLALGKPPATFQTPQHADSTEVGVIRMQFIGANPAPRAKGLDELASISNYFIGNEANRWHTTVPHYAKVQYEDIYPGIDLVYYGNQRQLEYDFVVAPGGDPENIRFAVHGVNRLEVSCQGEVIVHSAGGQVRLSRPSVYQQTTGVRQAVASRFVLRGEHQVGFEIAPYDTSEPLVIDPVLSYSTYLGGSSDSDFARGIALDAEGSAYITGSTRSTDFPTESPIQPDLGGDNPFNLQFDAFVTKLGVGGNTLVYSTYLGGGGADSAFAIAVDDVGAVYLTGQTTGLSGGSTGDFPTVNPFQPALNSNTDAFVTKVDPTGSALVYSSYLGGNGLDRGWDITVDFDGNAYIAGETHSLDFPTQNPFQVAHGGLSDGFVTKVDSEGFALEYSSYLGGGSMDLAKGIAVDSGGAAYVTGETYSPDFPTSNPLQAANAGSTDGFVTKVDATGSALVYSSYLGGTGSDSGGAIAVTIAGEAYLTGTTRSSDFPTESPIQPTIGGGGPASDAFVTKINATGSALDYSSYLGGRDDDFGDDIAVDSEGIAYVAGGTRSDDFPTENPIQPAHGFGFDAFVTKLSSAGFIFSTHLGGSSSDMAMGVAVDAAGNLYVGGYTRSTDFPTVNPFQGTNAGGNDAFVVKIGGENQAPVALCQALVVSADASCQAGAEVNNGSFDPDDDPIVLEASPPGPYSRGTTLVTLTVTDDHGGSDTCTALVTVEDTTPPELAVSLTPDTLWPPNHHLVNVDVTTIAGDNCDTPNVILTSVSSSEVDNGVGDGNTINDIQDAELGTADFKITLRAERAGGGNGRIYTVVLTAFDTSGNEASAADHVVVPHDQGGIIDPIGIRLQDAASGTLVEWIEVAGVHSHGVIRGQLGNITEAETVINLGTVVCVEAESSDASTEGSEDSEIPARGLTFFYLVEYSDGTSSSYGTESVGKPRAPGSGSCH